MNKEPIDMALAEIPGDFYAALCLAFEENHLPLPTREQGEKFRLLFLHMTEVNQTMNLTAIRGVEDSIVRHFADCAAVCSLFPENARVADIGAGAGFPTLPLAILRPDLRILAVDSTAKRIRYVKETAALLGLDRVEGLAARAEEMGQNPLYRERFDAVCARAVARLNILCEWCLPLCRVGGFFLAMKGKNGAEEHAEAKGALRRLGADGGKDTVVSLCDPFREEEDPDKTECRHLIIAEKLAPTPDLYPRKNGQITAKPLK